MNDTQIFDKINSFERWHYQIELAGHMTPIFRTDHINRHEQRKGYFFQSLVDLLGGSLAGYRVLDLGCNAGFWSLCAIESGCDYVLGIDGRQMHIEQAEFVFDVKGIDKDRYDFYCGNIFDLLNEELGKFDIVLCLGLMYHVSKPITLIERISAINTDLLVIDSLLSTKGGSIFDVRHESLDEPRHAVDYELVLVPTRAAILDMVHQFSYHSFVLKPNFTDYIGAADYENGSRRAFICAKQTDLSTLDIETNLPDDVQSTQTKPGGINLMEFPSRDLVRAFAAKMMRRLGLNIKGRGVS